MEKMVSVVIPTYNRAFLTASAVDSVLAQTYKNIEIIVVDDGSTDDTREVLAAYGNKIKYFYKDNGGCSSARNLGIKEAKGEYIAFLDSDDLWYPEKIQKQVAALTANPEFGLCICDIEVIEPQSNQVSFTNLRKIIRKDGYILKDMLRQPPITCSYMLASKLVFEEVGGFDESFKTANDFDMLLRICIKFKVVVVEQPLVKYKKSKDSVSNQLFTGSRLRAIDKLQQYAPDFVEIYPLLYSWARAKIHLSYAEDLLWSRHLKKARKQILKSFKNYFTLQALLLYLKIWLIQIMSVVAPRYRTPRIQNQENELK